MSDILLFNYKILTGSAKMCLPPNENDDLDRILKRDFTNVFRAGYINVKGVTMPQKFEELQEDIYKFDVREGDVWICSFPKTGTTWTQEMTWMIMNNLDVDRAQIDLTKRSPFLEVSALFDYSQVEKQFSEFKTPPFIEDSLKYVKNESEKGPMCLKTHLNWVLLPKQIQNGTKKPKIIYVTRNPKDTCVSYYHHCRLFEGYKGNFDNFTKLFLAGKLTYAPYWNHIMPFWKRSHQPNILFLKYEDMLKDLPSIIKKVAYFLERPLSEDQVAFLSNHLSFSSMKKNSAVNFEKIIAMKRKFNLTDCEGTFMRSGKEGDYKTIMTEDTIRKFDEWMEKNIEGTGFSF